MGGCALTALQNCPLQKLVLQGQQKAKLFEAISRCCIVFRAMAGQRHLPFKGVAEVPLGQPRVFSGDMSANVHNSDSGITYRIRVNLARQHNRSKRSRSLLARSMRKYLCTFTQKMCSHLANASRRRRFMANAWFREKYLLNSARKSGRRPPKN